MSFAYGRCYQAITRCYLAGAPAVATRRRPISGAASCRLRGREEGKRRRDSSQDVRASARAPVSGVRSTVSKSRPLAPLRRRPHYTMRCYCCCCCLCDVPCVTRERSLTARTPSPAADRWSGCPVAD